MTSNEYKQKAELLREEKRNGHRAGLIALYGSLGPIIVLGIGVYAHNIYASSQLQKSNKPVIATVIQETYQKPLPMWATKCGLSQNTRQESQYLLKIKTAEGRFADLYVVDGENRTKESLDAIVNQGSEISFPEGYWEMSDKGDPMVIAEETWFESETQAGSKRADRIEVLN